MSQLLRIATAGSVDDGKSTLIGRLLFDTKAVFEDQCEALPHRGVDDRDTPPDLALLTDGLRSEREQGITIDVAYRYFATPRRKFIIADAPGHVQYTRNMVTGASTADAALILVDARKGVLQQSRRHAFIASLLGLSHLVLCVNKMDLVDWSQQRYDAVREEFERFATKLEVDSITAVPVSALTGDNVVSRSDNLPWYTGPDLITCMEQLDTSSDGRLLEFRLPVQYVVRHQVEDSRHYTGTVAAGTIRPGDDVIVLPSGAATTVSQVHGPGGRALAVAGPDEAVSVRLTDDIDIGRGDMICQDVNRPHVSDELDAMLCWLSDDTALLQEHPYILQHTTSATRAWVHDVDYRLDIDTLDQDASAAGLSVNEIGRVRIHTQHPLLFDPYRRNRRTGSFTLIDEITNNTVAAGMIIGPGRGVPQLVWHDSAVARSERPSRGMTIWLTGLPRLRKVDHGHRGRATADPGGPAGLRTRW